MGCSDGSSTTSAPTFYIALLQFWRSPVRANESSNRGPTREDVPRPFFSFLEFSEGLPCACPGRDREEGLARLSFEGVFPRPIRSSFDFFSPASAWQACCACAFCALGSMGSEKQQ